MEGRRTVRVMVGVIWLVACLAPLAHAASVREEKTFSVSGTPDVTLRTFDGAIQVRTWDRSDIHVTIEKYAPTESAANGIAVNAEQDGNRITVEVQHPSFSFFSFGEHRHVDLIVSVPRTANLTAHSGDGSITVDGINGRVDLDSGDGRVAASNVRGDLNAHTGDGAVEIDGLQGTLRARSGDGRIRASGRLSAVTIGTGDGPVTLSLDPGSVMTTDWEINTGDGSISIGLPPQFDAEIDAHTGDGEIALEGVHVSVSGRLSRNSVRGTLGKGGHTLMLRAGDGLISLHAR